MIGARTVSSAIELALEDKESTRLTIAGFTSLPIVDCGGGGLKRLNRKKRDKLCFT